MGRRKWKAKKLEKKLRKEKESGGGLGDGGTKSKSKKQKIDSNYKNTEEEEDLRNHLMVRGISLLKEYRC